MRSFEFRAWSNQTDKYTSWQQIQERKNLQKLMRLSFIEIEQYTGLKDANGKKIFEGDILKDVDHFLCICVYSHEWGGFAFMTKTELDIYKDKGIKSLNPRSYSFYSFSNTDGFKVVGNIHQNKDLIS